MPLLSFSKSNLPLVNLQVLQDKMECWMSSLTFLPSLLSQTLAFQVLATLVALYCSLTDFYVNSTLFSCFHKRIDLQPVIHIIIRNQTLLSSSHVLLNFIRLFTDIIFWQCLATQLLDSMVILFELDRFFFFKADISGKIAWREENVD